MGTKGDPKIRLSELLESLHKSRASKSAEGYSIADISREMGIGTPTARKLISEAKAQGRLKVVLSYVEGINGRRCQVPRYVVLEKAEK